MGHLPRARATATVVATAGEHMTIKVDAYTALGIARGELARAGSLREVLEHDRALALDRVQWHPFVGVPAAASGMSIPIDDVLVAVGDEDLGAPVHATWHGIRLEVGPYLIEGEMPTLPGFDPGRALTRPTGEFVFLKDVSIGLRDDPAATPAHAGDHGLVNRYGVESVECDLMLGFFFPGAEMIQADVAETGAP
jgi:hypothetical protein